MPKIRVLSADLANQIAAGEVVERPASVVKELIENALDAGATKVRVELEAGGLARVRVSDDGEGMDEDDARRAFERHATSKIASIDDLERIRTFGFRGEALPSIASVSRLTLVTRARGADEGTEVTVDGGGAPRVRPAGCAEGTSVDVAELFFNVPARRKFMKSQPTESAHVSEVVLLAALARPDVAFTLARDGKVTREHLRAASRAERVGRAFEGERLEPCIRERGPLRIEAHLAAPERARAGAVALHLFVNGRPVKDRMLARAVAQAYGSVLEPGRYPVGVAYFELPPEMVDVNVHPQKAEVRFTDGRGLFDAIMRELHGALSRAFAVPALGASGRSFSGSSTAPTERDTLKSLKRAEKVLTPLPPAPEGPLSLANAPAPQSAAAIPYSQEPSTMKSLAERVAAQPREDGGSLFAEPGFYGRLRFCAQVRATFLVCEGDDGLYVLDQHAAAERVTFHRLRRSYGTRGVALQRLLIPELVPMSAVEVALVEDLAEQILAIGLEVRAVGSNAVAVHAVPRILGRAKPDRLVRDLVAELSREARRPFADAADLVLATMACHGSVRAGDVLSHEEAVALLRALDEVDFAGHCPHGRPVVTRVGFEDLERRVGR